MHLLLALPIILSLVGSPQTSPQDSSQQQLENLRQQLSQLQQACVTSDELASLQNRVDVLAEEVQKLRAPQVETPNMVSYSGLGPSASRVYNVQKGLSLAGYGEILYENRKGAPAIGDAQRMIVYFGYRFSPSFLFNSEIEFEHAFTEENLDGRAGEVALEFAYLDWLTNPGLNLRAGLILIPLGIINETHEPPTFHGVQRPLVERSIIPTTWREIGFGIFGDITSHLKYRAFLVNGLDARGFSANGIRGGRGNGGRARWETPAAVVRLDWVPKPGFQFGLGAYSGRADQNALQWQDQPVHTSVSLVETHAMIQWERLEFRGLGALTWISNSNLVNKALNLDNSSAIGGRMEGFYLELAYRVAGKPESWSLAPFVRYEQFDTQNDIAADYIENPEKGLHGWTLGFDIKPHPQVVIKVNASFRQTDNDMSQNEWNLGVGFNF